MITRREFGFVTLGAMLAKTANPGNSASALGASSEGGDIRRVGKRKNGAYWRVAGAHIDMLSGNLNLCLPLIRAAGRKSTQKIVWAYNSQIWRLDSAGVQSLGIDTGYGFGWSVQAGAIAPVYSSGSKPTGYTYINASGAEFPLTSVNGLWISRNGINVTYDPAVNRLYFNNGTLWVMSCVSVNSEPDVGRMYPTVIQDSNGNQILIRYLAGRGTSQPNTSSRIQEIEDVRSLNIGSGRRTYTFTYSAETLPHLLGITSEVGTTETYQFSYSSIPLQAPFGSAPNRGPVTMLQHVANSGPSCSCGAGSRNYGFNYSPQGTGELVGVSMPNGGQANWDYTTATFGDGRAVREVQACTLPGAANGVDISYTIDHPVGDTSGPIHSATTLRHRGQSTERTWTFNATPNSDQSGVLLSRDIRPQPGQPSLRRTAVRWASAPDGNLYRAAITTTLDVDTADQAQKRREVDHDAFGNKIATRYFEYGSPTAPARVVNRTYLNDPTYTTRYIRNRLVSRTVTDGTNAIVLVHRSYDTTPVIPQSGMNEHDTPNYGPAFSLRGNPTEVIRRGVYRRSSYDITGFRVGVTDAQNYSVSVSAAPGGNNAVPGLITPNGNLALSKSFVYDAANRPTHIAGPNAAQGSMVYDSLGRLASVTSPKGLTSTYSYAINPTSVTRAKNDRWRKITRDGLGRKVQIEHGGLQGTSSIVDIEYDTVHRHKIKRISAPHATGVNPDWKTYTYDALGRRTQIDLHGGLGSIKHVYAGNARTTTNPSGRWKKCISSASGRPLQVVRPNPTSGPAQQTSYQYTLLNKLAHVSMPTGAGTQQRSFQYDSNGRLLTKQHGETGLQSRTYNTDGTIASLTDAKGQKVLVGYDSYKRPISVTGYPAAGLTDPPQMLSMFYDTNPFDPNFSQNTTSRIAAVRSGTPNSALGQVTEMYSYTRGGQITGKRVRINRGANDVDLDIMQTYDSKGRLSSITYGSGATSLSYTYDSLGRPIRLTDTARPEDLVKDVVYDARGNIVAMKSLIPGSSEYYVENRIFNSRRQLTGIHAGPETPSPANAWMPVVNLEYEYDTATNDGKVIRVKDGITGDDIRYEYDAHGRLQSAGTVGREWGLAFTYDDFGNRTAQQATTGSAPAWHNLYDPATNRLVDAQTTYDANGNVTSLPFMQLRYDVWNRLVQASHSAGGVAQYSYDASGRRIWQKFPDGREQVYLYGVDGRDLATYDLNTDAHGSISLNLHSTNVYFHKRLIRSGDFAVVRDRSNSVRVRISEKGGTKAETSSYYPYGEEQQASTQDRMKFGSYVRDSTTLLDYAKHRYYSSTLGRFLTPDPYAGSARLRNPATWNRYTFVINDPVNHVDCSGLDSGNGSGSPPSKLKRQVLRLERDFTNTMIRLAVCALANELATQDITLVGGSAAASGYLRGLSINLPLGYSLLAVSGGLLIEAGVYKVVASLACSD